MIGKKARRDDFGLQKISITFACRQLFGGGDRRARQHPAAANRPAAAPTEARLNAHQGAADFAPELGAQLTLWVRDGVHEARLQLNPADMGPVEVKIALDGSAAQVSFNAQNEIRIRAGGVLSPAGTTIFISPNN